MSFISSYPYSGSFFLPFGQSISEFLPRSYYVKPVVLKTWIPIPGIMTSNPEIECIVVSEGKQERKETEQTEKDEAKRQLQTLQKATLKLDIKIGHR